jgi:hypothetical protein
VTPFCTSCACPSHMPHDSHAKFCPSCGSIVPVSLSLSPSLSLALARSLSLLVCVCIHVYPLLRHLLFTANGVEKSLARRDNRRICMHTVRRTEEEEEAEEEEEEEEFSQE